MYWYWGTYNVSPNGYEMSPHRPLYGEKLSPHLVRGQAGLLRCLRGRRRIAGALVAMKIRDFCKIPSPSINGFSCSANPA